MSTDSAFAVPDSSASTTRESFSGQQEIMVSSLAVPQVFYFTAQRWKTGMILASGATCLMALGVFLLSHIPTTRALATQLVILGVICVVAAVVLFVQSLRDLFGRLVLDSVGVRMTPVIAGFSIGWKELHRWEVKPDEDRHPEERSVNFWTDGRAYPHFIRDGFLTHHDRHVIRHTLMHRAPEKQLS